MFDNVCHSTSQQFGSVSKRTKTDVAPMTQQSSHLAGSVIVVNCHRDNTAIDHVRLFLSAYGASIALFFQQRIEFGRCYAVFLRAVFVSFRAVGVRLGYTSHVVISYADCGHALGC